MANRYTQISNSGTETHFSAAVTGALTFSSMTSEPEHLTTFNAGDLVPIYCMEVLPNDSMSLDMDFIVRQTTVLTPTMGSMAIDLYAFFVPNRIVNESWKTVMGENPNGSWTAPDISLATLADSSVQSTGYPSSVQIPVGSVADYYGFPTQQAMPVSILEMCHDLKFRGYVEIYNQFFRDQNYQPPIPYSKLNVYNDFFHLVDQNAVAYNLGSTGPNTAQDNSVGSGAVAQALYGNMQISGSEVVHNVSVGSSFNALGKPLKANRIHDQFTSVLPSPQKGMSVLVPLNGYAPVITSATASVSGVHPALRMSNASGSSTDPIGALGVSSNSSVMSAGNPPVGGVSVYPSNLLADLQNASSATIADLRTAAAVQSLYEQLARSGSRYREVCRGLFGLEVDDPYKDIPSYLGHVRRNLDLYQTAQTSASPTGGASGSAQGHLAAFGYTSSSGHIFKQKFLEHGYIHVLALVRHKNVYSSYLAQDNFRLGMLDFYQPPLANISEQPVYTRTINPYSSDPSNIFGYQEAWYEYRFDPSYVSGLMRPGTGSGPGSEDNLSVWNYADDFTPNLSVATGSWLQSNSEEVLNRTLAITSDVAPQLKGQFKFRWFKNRPMPTYSLPGLDIF